MYRGKIMWRHREEMAMYKAGREVPAETTCGLPHLSTMRKLISVKSGRLWNFVTAAFQNNISVQCLTPLLETVGNDLVII